MPRFLHRLRFVRDHGWVPQRASEYLDGELDPGQRRRLERHADDCPQCRELLSSLRALIGALGTIRHEEPPVVARTVLASIHRRLSDLPQDGP